MTEMEVRSGQIGDWRTILHFLDRLKDCENRIGWEGLDNIMFQVTK